MNKVIEVVLQTIGVPGKKLPQKKFLLQKDRYGNFIFDSDVKPQVFEVEETILRPGDPDVIESKVRSRGVGDSDSYVHEVR